MSFKTFTYLAIFFGLFFSSCIKEINEDFDYQNKIVVTSYLSSNDAVFRVELIQNFRANTKHISENYEDIPYIIDAIVTIKNDFGDERQLIYDANDECYSIDSASFHLIPGLNYYLNATTPDGKKITAKMTLPPKIQPPTLSIDSSSSPYTITDSIYYPIYSMKKDLELKVNFSASGDYYFVYTTVFYSNHYTTSSTDTVVHGISESFMSYSEKPAYLNNNNTLETKTTIKTESYDPVTSFDLSVDSVLIKVIATKEDYYKFVNSLEKQSSLSNDPFAEPAMLYSNIDGGLGIFTGFTVSANTVKYKP